MPNYTINKGTLAENMVTAAIEYPFALAENMGGNVSTARVLAIGPLKTLGMYRTWQTGRITVEKIGGRHRG